MIFNTIGVYNSSEETFFQKLIDNKIDTFIDIRQRRGVRGAKYSFVNSIRLQNKLNELDIKYIHILDLAPTKEIREMQKQEDLLNNELKRDRNKLGTTFVSEYRNQILKDFDYDSFMKNLTDVHATNIVMFCVEEQATACHRSIVAEELSSKYHYNILDL